MPDNTPVVAAGPTQVDTISLNGRGFQAFGSVAERLLAGDFNPKALRPLGVLQRDEWKAFDNVVIDVSRQRLRGIADLLSRGLTRPLRNPLGTTRLEWERVSDMSPAIISMSGLTESQNDRVLYDLEGLPIPIIHKDFQINIRALMASRNRGEALDTTQIEVATRKVNEQLEALLFAGGYSVGANGSIYGYTNFPDRNTGSTTADWDTATGAQIVGDVLAMIGKAQADFMYGPFVLYVSLASYTHMADDYKAESDRTILERVLAIPGISAVMPSENITDDGVVILVQMSRDVVDLITGMMPTVVQWESDGGMRFNFKVMAIMVPRLKSDFDGRSGLVHYS